MPAVNGGFYCMLAWMKGSHPQGVALPALICVLAVLPGDLLAADEGAAANCRFEGVTEPIAAGSPVSRVLDGRSFLLADGREVRLAGIEVPPLAESGTEADGQAPGHTAQAALERLLDGAHLSLRLLRPETDRYGRLLAHVLLERSGAHSWAQRDLVAQGHARVAIRHGAGCGKELLAAEHSAREAGLGLWADARFGPRPAEKADEILAERGRFALVEGKVLSVRESGGTVYLNFDRRWFRGFAATVLKRNERLFAAAGMELKKLEGRRVRIRGWVEERGGPRIEALGPEQIEITERN
jgi:endonuclease YncB( thermonuclease family)